MIIVRLQGGLGNQMFQYAMARHLAHRHNTIVKFDLNDLLDRSVEAGRYPYRDFDLDIFNIDPVAASGDEIWELTHRFKTSILDRLAQKLLGRKASYVLEPHYHYSESAYNSPDNVYLNGYWQSPRYFADIEPLLRREFTFHTPMNPKAEQLLAQITDENSVCLSVRRGDYLHNDLMVFHGVDYFQAADRVIRERLSDYRYYVFADEIEWCRQNLQFGVPTTFVSEDYSGWKYQDKLRLMAACKHFVIPNSSYTWWAVWFNQEPDRTVIVPKVWFNDPKSDTCDLIPEDWIRI